MRRPKAGSALGAAAFVAAVAGLTVLAFFVLRDGRSGPSSTATVTPLSLDHVPTAQPGQIRVWTSWLEGKSDAWVGGYYCSDTTQPQHCTGRIFRTADDGRTWQQQYHGDVVPIHVQFVDAQRGMAVGYGSDAIGSCSTLFWQTSCRGPVHVLVTDDGGLHWSETYQLQWSEPYVVDEERVELALSADDAWIAAEECTSPLTQIICETRLFRSGDDGRTWSRIQLSVGRLGGISRPTASDVWVWGYDQAGAATFSVTHDGGATWSDLPSPTQGGLALIFFRDKEEGWALFGDGPAAGSQPKEVLGTHDGGKSWTHLAGTLLWPPATPTSGSLTDGGYMGPIDFTSSSEGWMALERLGLLHSTDGGVTWQLAVRDPDSGYADVHFAGQKRGWAMNGYSIIATDDGGSNWRLVPPPTVEPP